ncbi:MAG: GNAT family N-acetyltransferase [Rhodococcus sp. (in: high G+C Gram-positive bacteria)]|uniref:GNAT family N-acetyltransferase n=1 Tax=Rhodococcus sp. TaxID=1831 RepID=UPI003BB1AA38
MAGRVTHDESKSRFEVYVDDDLAGFAEYAQRGNVRDFHHTVTYPQFRGQGLAGVLVKAALDDTNEQGMTVVPSCSYVERYIAQHPDYAELV